MSELDPAEVAPRSVRRAVPERFRKELEAPEPERATGEREGLPPSYRMRADAHYVDQLSARSPDMAVRFVSTDEIDGGGNIDPASIKSLTESIQTHGVLQPLLVRRDANRYRVIFGRRRLAASALAGLRSVPCVVHQADAKTAEELALAEGAPVGISGAGPTPDGVPVADAPALVARLAQEIAGIESAAAILAGQPPSTSRRVTLDLVRSQASRAAWMIEATGLVTTGERGETRLCLLGPVLDRAKAACLSESRLSGVSIELCVPDWNVSAVVDEQAVITGVTGALVATLGLLEQSENAVVTLMLSGTTDQPPRIEIGQEAVAVPADVVSRFFDPLWTIRPGGWTAALGARAARAAARQHGGDASFVARQGRGSTLTLTLGR